MPLKCTVVRSAPGVDAHAAMGHNHCACADKDQRGQQRAHHGRRRRFRPRRTTSQSGGEESIVSIGHAGVSDDAADRTAVSLRPSTWRFSIGGDRADYHRSRSPPAPTPSSASTHQARATSCSWSACSHRHRRRPLSPPPLQAIEAGDPECRPDGRPGPSPRGRRTHGLLSPGDLATTPIRDLPRELLQAFECIMRIPRETLHAAKAHMPPYDPGQAALPARSLGVAEAWPTTSPRERRGAGHRPRSRIYAVIGSPRRARRRAAGTVLEPVIETNLSDPSSAPRRSRAPASSRPLPRSTACSVGG